MSRAYFGTDGIRGRVGDAPMTPEFILRLGWAAGRVLAGHGRRLILIGKDTRISGYMFESVLESGLSAAGVNTRLLGPMPTPGVAYLTRTFRASAGIVISASHNPYYDNGIKFFSGAGTKLPDELEAAIEAELVKTMSVVDSAELGKVERVVDAAGRYIEFCKSTVPTGTALHGMKIVVDCANGATYHIAPAVFAELGAKVIPLCDEPDGININASCGSTAPRRLADAVLNQHADLGIAFDGDGDRVVMVDGRGETVDGDELLYIIAATRLERAELQGTGVVGTLMSNLGLEHALARLGIPFERAAVGDRYVMEALQRRGWLLGGENSGHLICLDRQTTGDGIVAALQVLAAMVATGRGLRELSSGLEKYPQVLVNVPLVPGFSIGASSVLAEAVSDVEASLGEQGRVLLRASGTEPLLRIMIEGRESRKVRALADQLAAAVRAEQNRFAVTGSMPN
ncbi:phosphoglucosamine mutase [Acidihalobacter yilgarnensis]|uniref:Phosphoglucosamine mutase n=1 Tax=Acidihalobacter yilgarnensis TaxID=2819280 RepID=A0A1D8IM40_9GAMM|nr:phosphoglucosamine mutase [Acidihalobacter yilgarnensis]AOU97530.1 phosphoglucosamine mutase [Acidihalobacter yilgarnensis]